MSLDFPVLSEREVHVWRVGLGLSAASVERLRRTLQPDEAARADRFHFEADRRRFTVARAALRILLGGYLKLAPARVRFRYGAYGKPFLETAEGTSHSLSFNLSHSHELALAAFARGRDIGVDLERVRAEFASQEIAERFFSPTEVVALRALPESIRHEAFFDCWTRKEAFIKALGEGLSRPLEDFDVTLAPAEPARLLSTRWDAQEAARWTLQAIDAAPGYKAAVAFEGYAAQLLLRDADEGFLLGAL